MREYQGKPKPKPKPKPKKNWISENIKWKKKNLYFTLAKGDTQKDKNNK